MQELIQNLPDRHKGLGHYTIRDTVEIAIRLTDEIAKRSGLERDDFEGAEDALTLISEAPVSSLIDFYGPAAVVAYYWALSPSRQSLRAFRQKFDRRR